MKKLPQIALGAWAWGNDGTFGIRDSKLDRRIKIKNGDFYEGKK